MVITNEEIEKRLNSPDNLINKIKEDKKNVIVHKKIGVNNPNGRGKAKSLTEEEKVALGALTKLEGAKSASELMGVSKSTAYNTANGRDITSVSHGSRGDVQHINSRNQDIQKKVNDRVNNAKLRIQEIAAEKLLTSIGLLDQEKLENSSARELAQISNQMAQVFKNMSPKEESNNGSGKGNVKIILNQPKMASEDSFDFVEVEVGS